MQSFLLGAAEGLGGEGVLKGSREECPNGVPSSGTFLGLWGERPLDLLSVSISPMMTAKQAIASACQLPSVVSLLVCSKPI